MPVTVRATAEDSLLLTDLYQFAMLEAYLARAMTAPAVFELFFRKLPPERGFLVAAGLAQALDFLEGARLSPDERDWLRRSGRLGPAAIDWLARFRFTGSVCSSRGSLVLRSAACMHSSARCRV